jgi:hypothetical protein
VPAACVTVYCTSGRGRPFCTSSVTSRRSAPLSVVAISSWWWSRMARSVPTPRRPRRAWATSVSRSSSQSVRRRRRALSSATCTRGGAITAPRSRSVRATGVTGMPSTVRGVTRPRSVLSWTRTPARRARRPRGTTISGAPGRHPSSSHENPALRCDPSAPGPAARTAASSCDCQVTGAPASRYTPGPAFRHRPAATRCSTIARVPPHSANCADVISACWCAARAATRRSTSCTAVPPLRRDGACRGKPAAGRYPGGGWSSSCDRTCDRNAAPARETVASSGLRRQAP